MTTHETLPLKITFQPLHHYADGARVAGPNPKMSGDCNGLWGDCSGLSGDCTGLWGDCSGLWGYCSSLSGGLDEIQEDQRPADIRTFAE
jgi:hypothetical protein